MQYLRCPGGQVHQVLILCISRIVDEEIEKMYSSPDDILQKKSYLRNRDSDGSNNYRIILEDRIDDDNYQRERTKKDPFRK